MSFTGQLGTTCSQLSLVELAVVPTPIDTILVKGSGAELRFTGSACDDAFLALDRDRNSLVRNADGSWTETQPDQVQLQYAVPTTPSGVTFTADLGSTRNLCGSGGDGGKPEFQERGCDSPWLSVFRVRSGVAGLILT